MGSGPDFMTGSTPQQQTVMSQGGPAYQRASGLAAEGLPLYDIGQSPMAPSYNVVNPDIMMPTQTWWNSLSPNVKSGLWAPYQEGAMGLQEMLAGQGQWGSPRGGVSGSAQTAMGKYASEASRNVGLQAWEMTQPAMQTYWSALQNREMYQPMADYQQAQQAWLQNIYAQQAAQSAGLGGYINTVNQVGSQGAWVPSTAERLMSGIFGGIGGAIGGYQQGGTGTAVGGAISGFGSGYYGS